MLESHQCLCEAAGGDWQANRATQDKLLDQRRVGGWACSLRPWPSGWEGATGLQAASLASVPKGAWRATQSASTATSGPTLQLNGQPAAHVTSCQYRVVPWRVRQLSSAPAAMPHFWARFGHARHCTPQLHARRLQLRICPPCTPPGSAAWCAPCMQTFHLSHLRPRHGGRSATAIKLPAACSLSPLLISPSPSTPSASIR